MDDLNHQSIKDESEARLPLTAMPEFIRPVEIDTSGIIGDLVLTEKQQIAGWLDAGGMPIWAIEHALGIPAGGVSTLRANKDYRVFIGRCVKVRAVGAINKFGDDVEGLLNDEIGRSIAALMEVRDNPFEKGANRIKAATEMLDRAPKAPKSKREVEERKTIISIPIGELQNMKQTLIEEGSIEDRDILDLLEGVDYISGDGENGDEKRINVKEVR